jgi:hypothetical protein
MFSLTFCCGSMSSFLSQAIAKNNSPEKSKYGMFFMFDTFLKVIQKEWFGH